MGHGLISRMLRALRLDVSLYREVATSDAGNGQAALVVLLVATGSSLAWIASFILYWVDIPELRRAWRLQDGWDGWIHTADLGAILQSAIPLAGYRTAALVVAWPVWAAGLWLLGTRWSKPNHSPPWFGHVTRALAFAQVPALIPVIAIALLMATWFAVGSQAIYVLKPNDVQHLTSLLKETVNVTYTVTPAWVSVATFLAMRQALGLSAGRTLVALGAVGAATAVLLGLIATAAAIAAGGEPWAQSGSPSSERASEAVFAVAYPIAEGFSFNFVVELSERVVVELASVFGTEPWDP
ncbi:MAG: hypothetical protein OXG65_01820 [Chloroflexi bacterium]|nr:hypothetical protein [Chloroflexota bacterium]